MDWKDCCPFKLANKPELNDLKSKVFNNYVANIRNSFEKGSDYNSLKLSVQYKIGRAESSNCRRKFFEYFPVPKRCQEIRRIKIHGVNQPFFTIFWRENHKKYEIKRD